MNAVIYARYSSERQTEQSIEGQLRECMEFAEQNDIQVIGTYIDRAKSGRTDNRADFQKMLRDSKSKAFEAVIVWKIDRFGRNREDIAKNKAILRKNGVTVLYAKEHIPDGAEGIILEGLLESLAEYYSAELKEKIVRGMRESAYKCKYNGSGLALGYSVDSDHNFHIDHDRASVVQKIFSMYDEGARIVDIQKYLNERNIKTNTGRDFSHNAVSKLLRNRRYIGEYSWNDIVIPNGMPQIINEELFERVQKRMDKNKRAPSAGRGEAQFLLTGKIFCGMCKGTMIGDSGTGKGGNKFYYYSCRHKKKDRTCKKKSVKKDWLEHEVTRLTASVVLQDDVISYIADKVVEIKQKEHADKSMLEYYNERLNETNSAIRNIMKAIEAGIITDTTRNRLMELEDERADIEIEIAKESILRPTITREQVIFFLNRFKGGQIEDKEYQKKIIDMFVNKVILYDDKLIITYNYSGDDNETTAEIIEEAALSDSGGCSDKCLTAPPAASVANKNAFHKVECVFVCPKIYLIHYFGTFLRTTLFSRSFYFKKVLDKRQISLYNTN